MVHRREFSAFTDTRPHVVPKSSSQSISHNDVVSFAFPAGFFVRGTSFLVDGNSLDLDDQSSE